VPKYGQAEWNSLYAEFGERRIREAIADFDSEKYVNGGYPEVYAK
jgi:hypothetical protein